MADSVRRALSMLGKGPRSSPAAQHPTQPMAARMAHPAKSRSTPFA